MKKQHLKLPGKKSDEAEIVALFAYEKSGGKRERKKTNRLIYRTRLHLFILQSDVNADSSLMNNTDTIIGEESERRKKLKESPS